MASYGHPIVTKGRVEELEAQVAAQLLEICDLSAKLADFMQSHELNHSRYLELCRQVAALTKERSVQFTEFISVGNKLAAAQDKIKALEAERDSYKAMVKEQWAQPELVEAQARIKVLRAALEKVRLKTDPKYGVPTINAALDQPDDHAALDAALKAERERCAKVCDEQIFNTNVLLSDPAQSSAAWQIRCAIREMK